MLTQFETTSHIELLPLLFEVDDEYLLIVLLYCTGLLETFIDTLLTDSSAKSIQKNCTG